MTTDSYVAAGLERFLRSRGREGLEELLADNPLMHLKMHQSYADLVDDALRAESVRLGANRFSTPFLQVLAALVELDPYATRAAVVDRLLPRADPGIPPEHVAERVSDLLDDAIAWVCAWPLDLDHAASDPDGVLLGVNPGIDRSLLDAVDTERFDPDPPPLTHPAGPVDDDASARALGAVTDAALSLCRRLDLHPFRIAGPAPSVAEQDELCRQAGVDPVLGELVVTVLLTFGDIAVQDAVTDGYLLSASTEGTWRRVSRAAFAKHLGGQWFRGFEIPEIQINEILDDLPDRTRIISPEALDARLVWTSPLAADRSDDDGADCAGIGHGPTPATRYLEIAEAVGMLQDGALTMYGRALVRDRGLVGAVVSSLLGAETTPVLLGDDLTATAVGELDGELVRVLDLAAEREPGTGPAVWRFTVESLARAGEADLAPTAVRRCLEDAIEDEVPTPLDELISAVANGTPLDAEASSFMWDYQVARILES